MWDTISPFILGFAVWAVLALGWHITSKHWKSHGPGNTLADFVLLLVARLVAWFFHRVRYFNKEIVPRTNQPGPLIVVSNHTGPVDSVLLQSACRFNIRWMMATDTMFPALDWLWSWRQMIAVDRDGKDLAAAREAIRHVKSGGVIGLFPEGRIITPPERVWPFADGVGLIVSRTNAPVLLVWISGTPPTVHALPSMFGFSHARVHFLELIQFPKDAKAAEITRTLREKIAKASGWPMTERDG
jgi:1-acyl-sn-glycerol-3-phosphate acyltransferase